MPSLETVVGTITTELDVTTALADNSPTIGTILKAWIHKELRYILTRLNLVLGSIFKSSKDFVNLSNLSLQLFCRQIASLADGLCLCRLLRGVSILNQVDVLINIQILVGLKSCHCSSHLAFPLAPQCDVFNETCLSCIQACDISLDAGLVCSSRIILQLVVSIKIRLSCNHIIERRIRGSSCLGIAYITVFSGTTEQDGEVVED